MMAQAHAGWFARRDVEIKKPDGRIARYWMGPLSAGDCLGGVSLGTSVPVLRAAERCSLQPAQDLTPNTQSK